MAFDALELFGLSVGDDGGQELAADALAPEICFQSLTSKQASPKTRLRDDASVFDEHIGEQQHFVFDPAIEVGGAGVVEFEAEIDELFNPFLGKFKNTATLVANELFHGAVLNGFNLS